MKRQWKIHREVQEYLNGQDRWDRAYHLILEIAHSVVTDPGQPNLEVSHASSDLCEGIDPTSSTGPDHRAAVGTVDEPCQPTGVGAAAAEYLSR